MKRQPKIVYKYRDWQDQKHKSIIIENILYLASPKDFNDPFDCRINENINLLNLEEEDEYINKIAIKYFAETERQGKDFQKVLLYFENRIKNRKEFQEFNDSMLYEYQDESYAIFSCCKEWNNIAMWSYYSNNHKGICIGFWTKKMMDSNHFGKLGEVVYKRDYPELKPRIAELDEQLITNSFIETHTKAKVWANEKEYRFMANHFPKALSLSDRKVKIENSFFAEIILGINIPASDKKEVIEICSQKNIKVYQAIKEDFKFKIKRVEL